MTCIYNMNLTDEKIFKGSNIHSHSPSFFKTFGLLCHASKLITHPVITEQLLHYDKGTLSC